MFRQAIFCSLCAVILSATMVAAQTTDDLVEKNVRAMGGREKIRALQTLRATGKMAVGQGMEASVSIELTPPTRRIRLDFNLQGLTGTQVFDGVSGWQVLPFEGKTVPEAMTADDIEEMQESTDFLGPLLDYKEKGHKVEYLGITEIAGTAAYKLKLTQKEGGVTFIYLDADTYLELKEELSKTAAAETREVETTFADFRKVEGLTLPFRIEWRPKGVAINKQTLSIDRFELNVEILPTRFEMPKVEKKREEPAASPPHAG